VPVRHADRLPLLPELALVVVLARAECPAGIERLPPRTGEHGREILRELGLLGDEIDALLKSGSVVAPAA